MNTRGFTLIETLVYLGLYAILMTGALVAMYSLFESSNRNLVKAMVQEEGSFLTGKIDWVLTGVQTINLPVVPPSPTSGPTLSVTKYDTSIGNPIVIGLSGHDLTISKAGGPATALNNSNVSLGNLVFTHTAASGDGINPESLSASFTLFSTTSDGLPFSQNFSTIKYLRK